MKSSIYGFLVLLKLLSSVIRNNLQSKYEIRLYDLTYVKYCAMSLHILTFLIG